MRRIAIKPVSTFIDPCMLCRPESLTVSVLAPSWALRRNCLLRIALCKSVTNCSFQFARASCSPECCEHVLFCVEAFMHYIEISIHSLKAPDLAPQRKCTQPVSSASANSRGRGGGGGRGAGGRTESGVPSVTPLPIFGTNLNPAISHSSRSRDGELIKSKLRAVKLSHSLSHYTHTLYDPQLVSHCIFVSLPQRAFCHLALAGNGGGAVLHRG